MDADMVTGIIAGLKCTCINIAYRLLMGENIGIDSAMVTSSNAQNKDIGMKTSIERDNGHGNGPEHEYEHGRGYGHGHGHGHGYYRRPNKHLHKYCL